MFPTTMASWALDVYTTWSACYRRSIGEPNVQTVSAEEKRLREEIIEFSRMLVQYDLLEFKGGNLSARVDEGHMLITRRGMKKGIPDPDDIVRTAIDTDDDNAMVASSAMEIHRAIYRKTDALAIVHAHPSKTVSLSFFMDVIRPQDENGLLYLGATVSVVGAPTLFGWNLVAEEMADGLVEGKVAVEKWHGTFAKGQDLGEAFHRTRAMEFTAGHLIQVQELRAHFGVPTMPPTEVAEVIGGIATRGLRKVEPMGIRRSDS